MSGLDEALFRVVNGWYAGASWAWDLLNHPWAAAVLAVVAVVSYWDTRTRRYLLVALLAVGVSDVACARVVKPLVARQRPCATLDAVSGPAAGAGIHCGSGQAMPSCHAANSAALAGALGSPGLAAVAAVVGVGRVASGQHWPSDVLAGWAIGGTLGLGLRWAVARALSWP